MTLQSGLLLDTTGDLWLLWGMGSPLGDTLSDRGKGSLYLQLDAVPNNFLWAKTNGDGNPTAWALSTTSAQATVGFPAFGAPGDSSGSSSSSAFAPPGPPGARGPAGLAVIGPPGMDGPPGRDGYHIGLSDPRGDVPAAQVTSGTFGSASGDVGTYTFSHQLTVTGLLAASANATVGGTLGVTGALTAASANFGSGAGAVTGGAASFTTGIFSGLATLTGGFTASANSTVQAASGSTRLNVIAGTNTSASVIQFQNANSTSYYVGAADSLGSFFGSTAYALVMYAPGTTPINLMVGGATILAINSASATFGSNAVGMGALTATTGTFSGLIAANGGLTVASGQTLTLTGATVTGLSFTTLTSSGAATLDTGASGSSFGGALGVTGLLTLSNNILLADGQTINWGGVGTGTWISASTAGHDIQMLVNSAPVLTLTTSLVQCGQPFRLANAYVSGVIVATGHVTIQDSTGTTYQVLCHT